MMASKQCFWSPSKWYSPSDCLRLVQRAVTLTYIWPTF